MIVLDPVAPLALLVPLTLLLAAFTIWRIVAAAPERPSRSRSRERLAWALRLVAVLLLLVVALRPVIPAQVEQRPTSSGGLEVYIAVDTTSSMAAEDWSGQDGNGGDTRLDGVKVDIAAMADALPGAGFSLITFDRETVQRVPLTSDGTALVSAAEVLTQEITFYSRGSSIDEPVGLLTSVLADAEEENPGQERVLFYLGDGEQTAPGEPGSFDGIAEYIDGGAVLGYGTDEGARMREFAGFSSQSLVDPETGEEEPPTYILDTSTGEPAVSRFDEDNLETIAGQLGVEYLHRSGSTTIDPLLGRFDVGEVTVTEGSQTAAVEFYWIPAALLALIALLELLRLGGALGELRSALRTATKKDER
jgi:Ca-activated chloride channel family protein